MSEFLLPPKSTKPTAPKANTLPSPIAVRAGLPGQVKSIAPDPKPQPAAKESTPRDSYEIPADQRIAIMHRTLGTLHLAKSNTAEPPPEPLPAPRELEPPAALEPKLSLAPLHELATLSMIEAIDQHAAVEQQALAATGEDAVFAVMAALDAVHVSLGLLPALYDLAANEVDAVTRVSILEDPEIRDLKKKRDADVTESLDQLDDQLQDEEKEIDEELRRRKDHPEREAAEREQEKLDQEGRDLDRERSGANNEREAFEKNKNRIWDDIQDKSRELRDLKNSHPSDPAEARRNAQRIAELEGDLTDLQKDRIDLEKSEVDLLKREGALERAARNHANKQNALDALRDRGLGMTESEHRQHLKNKAWTQAELEKRDLAQQIEALEKRGGSKSELDRLRAELDRADAFQAKLEGTPGEIRRIEQEKSRLAEELAAVPAGESVKRRRLQSELDQLDRRQGELEPPSARIDRLSSELAELEARQKTLAGGKNWGPEERKESAEISRRQNQLRAEKKELQERAAERTALDEQRAGLERALHQAEAAGDTAAQRRAKSQLDALESRVDRAASPLEKHYQGAERSDLRDVDTRELEARRDHVRAVRAELTKTRRAVGDLDAEKLDETGLDRLSNAHSHQLDAQKRGADQLESLRNKQKELADRTRGLNNERRWLREELDRIPKSDWDRRADDIERMKSEIDAIDRQLALSAFEGQRLAVQSSLESSVLAEEQKVLRDRTAIAGLDSALANANRMVNEYNDLWRGMIDLGSGGRRIESSPRGPSGYNRTRTREEQAEADKYGEILDENGEPIGSNPQTPEERLRAMWEAMTPDAQARALIAEAIRAKRAGETPDLSLLEAHPSVKAVKRGADGSLEIDLVDGSKITLAANGDLTTEKDGITFIEHPDQTQEMIRGSIRSVWSPDGTVKSYEDGELRMIERPDGSAEWSKGNRTIRWAPNADRDGALDLLIGDVPYALELGEMPMIAPGEDFVRVSVEDETGEHVTSLIFPDGKRMMVEEVEHKEIGPDGKEIITSVFEVGVGVQERGTFVFSGKGFKALPNGGFSAGLTELPEDVMPGDHAQVFEYMLQHMPNQSAVFEQGIKNFGISKEQEEALKAKGEPYSIVRVGGMSYRGGELTVDVETVYPDGSTDQTRFVGVTDERGGLQVFTRFNDMLIRQTVGEGGLDAAKKQFWNGQHWVSQEAHLKMSDHNPNALAAGLGHFATTIMRPFKSAYFGAVGLVGYATTGLFSDDDEGAAIMDNTYTFLRAGWGDNYLPENATPQQQLRAYNTAMAQLSPAQRKEMKDTLDNILRDQRARPEAPSSVSGPAGFSDVQRANAAFGVFGYQKAAKRYEDASKAFDRAGQDGMAALFQGLSISTVVAEEFFSSAFFTAFSNPIKALAAASHTGAKTSRVVEVLGQLARKQPVGAISKAEVEALELFGKISKVEFLALGAPSLVQAAGSAVDWIKAKSAGNVEAADAAFRNMLRTAAGFVAGMKGGEAGSIAVGNIAGRRTGNGSGAPDAAAAPKTGGARSPADYVDPLDFSGRPMDAGLFMKFREGIEGRGGVVRVAKPGELEALGDAHAGYVRKGDGQPGEIVLRDTGKPPSELEAFHEAYHLHRDKARGYTVKDLPEAEWLAEEVRAHQWAALVGEARGWPKEWINVSRQASSNYSKQLRDVLAARPDLDAAKFPEASANWKVFTNIAEAFRAPKDGVSTPLLDASVPTGGGKIGGAGSPMALPRNPTGPQILDGLVQGGQLRVPVKAPGLDVAVTARARRYDEAMAAARGDLSKLPDDVLDMPIYRGMTSVDPGVIALKLTGEIIPPGRSAEYAQFMRMSNQADLNAYEWSFDPSVALRGTKGDGVLLETTLRQLRDAGLGNNVVRYAANVEGGIFINTSFKPKVRPVQRPANDNGAYRVGEPAEVGVAQGGRGVQFADVLRDALGEVPSGAKVWDQLIDSNAPAARPLKTSLIGELDRLASDNLRVLKELGAKPELISALETRLNALPPIPKTGDLDALLSGRRKLYDQILGEVGALLPPDAK